MPMFRVTMTETFATHFEVDARSAADAVRQAGALRRGGLHADQIDWERTGEDLHAVPMERPAPEVGRGLSD